MNDSQIRAAYHRQRLSRHHSDPQTLVLDELGLQHGRCRADIAVINGHLVGFEIKSDVDSLHRLESQVLGYNAVFDRIVLVAAERHVEGALQAIPEWWGLVCAVSGPRGGIRFKTVRQARTNVGVDNFCVAQLLWREEAKALLVAMGVEDRDLRGNRASLYEQLVTRMGSTELRRAVRETIKRREGWQHPSLLERCDDSFPWCAR